MPVYFFWGDDDFAMNRAIAELRDRTLDPAWASFNYEKIPPDAPNAVTQALAQAVTPPFGSGQRLVWLADTTLGQRCPEELLKELQRTLPQIPESAVLLLSAKSKPDGRLKATKFLQKQAEVREFSLIPPWKTEQLVAEVKRAAQELKLAIAPDAADRLAEAVGNDTRQRYSELEKLHLFVGDRPITDQDVAAIVTTSTQTSLELAKAIRSGETARALGLVADLIARNEAALRIVATLVGQFRMWLWVKVMVERRERDDRAIAQAADIGNPKRIYFLKQEVQRVSLDALRQALGVLLELEWALKRGGDDLETLQTKTIELCALFDPNSSKMPVNTSARF